MAFPQVGVGIWPSLGCWDPGLINAALALALTGWPAYARLARSETLYCDEATTSPRPKCRALWGSALWGHILPACIPAMRVRLALDLAAITVAAAALGFLGLGMRPPTPEWGMMIAEGSKVVFDQWWVAAFPGAAIFLTSLAFNSLADRLGDMGDPRHG